MRRYSERLVMTIDDLLFELQIAEHSPAAMLIANEFVSEAKGIRVSTGIDYILEHL